MKKPVYLGKVDFVLPLIAFLLVVISVATIYTITFSHNGFNLAKGQIIFIIIGLVIYFAAAFVDYRVWRNLSFPLYIVAVILLIMVDYFGKSAFGATRWINLGFFQFQPSELMKIALILLLARFYESRVERISWKHLIVGSTLLVLPALLVLKQPDFGTATVLIISFISILIGSKLNWKYILGLFISFLVAAPYIWNYGLKEFQKERLLTFLNPTLDPYGSGYNVLQSIIAVGSGGLTGQGFGQGSQSQLNYLPVAHADFIFAGFAEATGFVGACFLLSLFIVLIVRILLISLNAKENFGQLVALGVGAMFLWQVFVNISMNIGLAPVTGIPLPFMSHGGTAMVVNFFALGILQNIYMKSREELFNA